MTENGVSLALIRLRTQVVDPPAAPPGGPGTASPTGSLPLITNRSTGAATAVPRRGRQRWLVPAVAVIGIAAVLVVSLWASGLVSKSAPAPQGAGALDYFDAATRATAAVSGYAGGGWAVISAVGYAVTVSITIPAHPGPYPGCDFAPMSSTTPTTLAVSPTGTAGSLGTSTVWLFLLRNSTDATVFVAVAHGTAQILGTIVQSGAPAAPTCTWNTLHSWYHPAPSDVVDSTTALASTQAAGGSAFLASHPLANLSFALLGGFTGPMYPAPPADPTWSVVYSSCPVGSAGTPAGAAFVATVNATSASVTNSTAISGTCASQVTYPLPPSP